jgi:hypothetical protein
VWLLYLEVAILVVLFFALGALAATLVLKRVVKDAPPGDEVRTP